MNKQTKNPSLSYTIGFAISLFLTVIAFSLVMLHDSSHHTVFSHTFLTTIIMFLAIIQLFVQLLFFLHIGRGPKVKWNMIVLLFAAIVVFIVVGGSLWIMSNLNYRMMSPSAVNQYMQNQQGL